jgi:hypothetical protein
VQAEAVAADLLKGYSRVEPGKRTLVDTRRQVESGWRSLAISLAESGYQDLARDAQRFVDRMELPRTEKELIAGEILERTWEWREKDRVATR